MAKHQAVQPEKESTPHEQLLNGLSSLASKVEDWISMHGLRFTASEAYSELVRRALAELKETPSRVFKHFRNLWTADLSPPCAPADGRNAGCGSSQTVSRARLKF